MLGTGARSTALFTPSESDLRDFNLLSPCCFWYDITGLRVSCRFVPNTALYLAFSLPGSFHLP